PALDVVVGEDGLDHALDALTGERLPVDLEPAAVRLCPPEELAGRVESGLAGALRVPDPAELGLVLRAAAVVEEIALDDDLDSVRAQVISVADGEGRGYDCTLDPELAAGP